MVPILHRLIVAILVGLLLVKPLSKARLHLLLCLKTNLAVILVCHAVEEVLAVDEGEHAFVLSFEVFQESQ